MLLSGFRLITFRRAPARLCVMRHDGTCWGRLVLPDGAEFDVTTRRDRYGDADPAALDAFERAARNPE